MRTTHAPQVVLAGSAGLCIALAMPILANAKGPSTDETVAAAKGSKLFRRTLQRDQLKAAGLGEVTLSPGVQLDMQGFVKATALDSRPELAPLLDPKLPAGLLSSTPVYQESIYELEDRLVVDRKLTVALAPGACNQPGKPQAVADLCFTKNTGKKAPKEVTQDLVEVRSKLAKAPADKLVRGTVTAAQARQMDDEQLLDLLLNTGTRTMHLVSVVPRTGGKTGAGGGDALQQFGAKLDASLFETGLIDSKQVMPGPKLDPGDVTPGNSKNFAREYFLTGFTYGREIEDRWEYTFADSTWLTDRYFVRVDYHLGLGFGVRAPFSIDVKATDNGADRRDVALSVAPVNVDTSGSPAYQAVGLPANKTFDGKELVLEFKASCGLYVSLPGPNIDKKCPTIDLSYSRDINPVIGNESSNIGDWWLDGSVTGLGISVAMASVSLDVGLGADVTKGVIGMRASALPSSGFQGWNAGNVAFTSRNPISFAVTRTAGASGAGFRLDQPSYGFDLRVMPKLRARVKVDVSVYEKTWVLGPYALGFLSISRSFQLGHHAGTVAQHDYPLFTGGQGPVLDPGVVPPKKWPGKSPASLPTPDKASKASKASKF